jgi:hypothetical protein
MLETQADAIDDHNSVAFSCHVDEPAIPTQAQATGEDEAVGVVDVLDSAGVKRPRSPFRDWADSQDSATSKLLRTFTSSYV